MKKVLIFGANGFVGPYLTSEFLSNGYSILASDMAHEFKMKNVDYVEADILDSVKVNSIISSYKPDYLINLAAISSVGLSWKIPSKTFQVNVIGTLNILDAIKNSGIDCKTLIIGSSEEYRQKNSPISETDEIDANNPYGISKVSQEKLAEIYSNRYGLKIIFTRSFNHTGIGQNSDFVLPSFCSQIAEIEARKSDGEIRVGNLSAYRDFSGVSDIVKCYRLLLEKTDGGIFNVGSGIAYSIEELLKIIIGFCKYKVNIIIDENKVRPIDTPYICADNSKMMNLCNFKFKKIEDVLSELYNSFTKKH